ncbi:hypothetical protein [Nocardioides acrostichi]|uniref:Uncharacterized protein n=1 Tax=Nocardioides acrostichi TaxID=2784339 RepID=A0A930UXX8_9ACTN|nr:hypothetical protein [Nocardioides acrostichi]MBF4162918.1 hypothetical protein [Nocardioides acrostichi]
MSGLSGLVVAALVACLSSCSVLDRSGASDDASGTPSSTSTATSQPLVDSQFTRDGTFQSHISADGVKGIDFVYTLYPTKSTPRTNEWFPRGSKYFSFTFQAYDLSQKIRAPFATKRKVYLQTMKVTSNTITVDGGKTQHPYRLEALAKDVTFDPEPLTLRQSMLISSPKGAFELRNQRIAPTSLKTRGLELSFTAVVFVQAKVGGSAYVRRVIKQTVPIQIFESDKPTEVSSIPVDAN